MKIKVKEITAGCIPVRSGGVKSDCFDLYMAEDVSLKKGELLTVKLGIAAELPKGTVATLYLRSSTPKNWGVMLANSIGFIDNTYNGNNDEWKAPLYAFRTTIIPRGTRICQFEVRPSQFATIWQKLRWILSSKLSIVPVKELGNKSRGGIGSTGK